MRMSTLAQTCEPVRADVWQPALTVKVTWAMRVRLASVCAKLRALVVTFSQLEDESSCSAFLS